MQLQKEINELQLENRIIKAKMPIHLNDHAHSYALKSDNNPYVSWPVLSSRYWSMIEEKSFGFWKVKEILLLRKENECLVEELNKLQDTISNIKLEKSVKSIELYDPNNPEFLQKKLSETKRKNFFGSNLFK